MGKKLAIKGHPTRGKEVIELLKMMGGSNTHNLSGCNDYAFYINDGHQNIIRGGMYIFGDEFMQFFTLEEFLKKYPFKVGDKVIDVADGCPGVVSEMKWDADVSDMKYFVVFGNGTDFGWFPTGSIEFCKENKNLEETPKMKNVLAELLEHIKTTPKEELKKEFKEIEEWSNVGPTVEEFMTFCESVNKKPKYPKLTNLTECKEILGEKDIYQSVSGYKGELLTNFQLLLIFRDVYWKIAGEKLGLDKPWEPDWNDHNQPKFGIHTVQNNIRPINIHVLKNFVLVFPTEEMRDAFYKNFEDLIERCKVLL